jgi:Icc-related predicted phosphoesterase
MKFQYCSDLHLEFSRHSEYFKIYPIKPSAKILILAGDITYLRDDFYTNPFFDYISKNWEKTFWIPGNHEYYCGIDVISYNLSEPVPIRKNVFLLDNSIAIVDDIRLIFSTLWSKMDMQHHKIIESFVSDFECIVYNNRKLNSESFNDMHVQSLNFIKDALKQNKNGKNIVVTHHLPSQQCNHPDYSGSKLNSAFVSNLDDLIKKSEAFAWIYGHSHKNMPEIQIGKTKLLTNQFGYISHNEHKGFSNSSFISID